MYNEYQLFFSLVGNFYKICAFLYSLRFKYYFQINIR